jgi:hypothetical protein
MKVSLAQLTAKLESMSVEQLRDFAGGVVTAVHKDNDDDDRLVTSDEDGFETVGIVERVMDEIDQAELNPEHVAAWAKNKEATRELTEEERARFWALHRKITTSGRFTKKELAEYQRLIDHLL